MGSCPNTKSDDTTTHQIGQRTWVNAKLSGASGTKPRKHIALACTSRVASISSHQLLNLAPRRPPLPAFPSPLSFRHGPARLPLLPPLPPPLRAAAAAAAPSPPAQPRLPRRARRSRESGKRFPPLSRHLLLDSVLRSRGRVVDRWEKGFSL
jgi:hypothetical protein